MNDKILNEITDELIEKQYEILLPVCENRHPKTGESCRNLYATNLDWCPGCIKAKELISFFKEHEHLARGVLEYLAEAHNMSNEELEKKRQALYYYATYEI